VINLVDREAAAPVGAGQRLMLAATVPGIRVALSLERV
jgi:hypothetical protein